MNESSNSTTNVSGIGLTEEIRETLLNLGALGWSEDDIAVYFGWDRAALHDECTNPDSEISKILLRGRLQKRAEVEIRLMKEEISRRPSSMRTSFETNRFSCPNLTFLAAQLTKVHFREYRTTSQAVAPAHCRKRSSCILTCS